MRILTKKIHRAYPELDKFDDAVCKRYIKRAKRLQNSWKFWLFLLIILPLAWALWAVLMFGTMKLLEYLHLDRGGQFFNNLEIALLLFSATGIGWLPMLATLLTRDRWLHRCIRKQLVGVQCPTCGYSLIGLSLLKDTPAPTVHCPECGHTTALKTLGLTEADIDPTLIKSS